MLIKPCEKCDRKRLWFLIKKRWYTHPIGGKVKSELAICGKCGNILKRLFVSMKDGGKGN